MRKFVLHCLLLMVATFHAPGSQARDNRYHVISYLGIEQGLSNNSVTCIFQDHKGFMWFGTYDGLNRYDGYSFKVYRHGLTEQNTLPNNRIAAIAEDSLQRLWIGTRS